MEGNIIADLVDGECILAAALTDIDGFTLERSSIDLRPNDFAGLLELNDSSNLTSILTDNFVIISSKLDTGHMVMIKCPKDGNIGKARMKLADACRLIANYVQ